ncbi:MAG: hypothetical protein IKS36_03490 [Bacteroidales bacterium]|nr:hypothetical protein [Bacteroidales bacterium]
MLISFGVNAVAQGTDSLSNYYSNHQKGIKPHAPKAYINTSVASKSDNITVDLIGQIPDTTKRDTTPSGFNLERRTIQTESYSLYPYDPWYHTWYGSYYDPWYHPWGYDHWMMSHCWTCGPYIGGYYGWGYYWDFGPYWSFGWGYPWYWNHYYAYYGYYWGRPYHGYGNYYGNSDYGYGLLSNSRNGNRSGNVAARPRTSTSPAPIGRTVRRGGVDLNNGGRAPHGRISGTGTIGRESSSTSRGTSVTSRGSYGRYAKPASVTAARTSTVSSRNGNVARGTSYSRSSSNTRTSFSNSSRSSYRSSSFESPSRSSSTFRTNTSSSRSNSTFRSNNSSSRSSSSSFRSSSSSRSNSSSSFRSSSSSSRSSSSGGSFRSSGGGSRGRR